MKKDVEKVITIDVGRNAGTRLIVADWDEGGGWLYMSMSSASMSVILTRAETVELIAALRFVIEPELTSETI